jgi:hypothetical protein
MTCCPTEFPPRQLIVTRALILQRERGGRRECPLTLLLIMGEKRQRALGVSYLEPFLYHAGLNIQNLFIKPAGGFYHRHAMPWLNDSVKYVVPGFHRPLAHLLIT